MDYGPQKLADIRALGPANIVIRTDLGQPGRVNYELRTGLSNGSGGARKIGLQPVRDRHDDQAKSCPLPRLEVNRTCHNRS